MFRVLPTTIKSVFIILKVYHDADVSETKNPVEGMRYFTLALFSPDPEVLFFIIPCLRR